MSEDQFAALDAEALAQSSKIVFRQGFGMELLDSQPAEPLLSGLWVSGAIFFSGDWSGLLRVELPVALARGFTSQWLGLSEDELDPSAVDDAIGELANTVAGILKPALPGIKGMSVPRVSGTELSKAVRDPKRTLQAVLALDGQPLHVSLWKCPPQFKMLVVPKPKV
jgi:hypothetical protein